MPRFAIWIGHDPLLCLYRRPTRKIVFSGILGCHGDGLASRWVRRLPDGSAKRAAMAMQLSSYNSIQSSFCFPSDLEVIERFPCGGALARSPSRSLAKSIVFDRWL